MIFFMASEIAFIQISYIAK